MQGVRGSLWVLKCQYCHQMITQTHPRGDRKVFKNFSRCMPAWKRLKMVESSLARARGGGGATGGTRSSDLGPLLWVRGSVYKKKVIQDSGPVPHIAAAICKEVLTPPNSPKWGTEVWGVGGSKSENSSGDHFLSKNDDFKGGWTSDTTTWGMLRERTHKGEYTTPAHALISSR